MIDDASIMTATMTLDECGLGEYDTIDACKAIKSWVEKANKNTILSYGELGFQSKIMHDGIGNKRLHMVCPGFIGVRILSAKCSSRNITVKYYIMPSCADLVYANPKYHLVPRVKKYEDRFELITFDVELD